MANYLLHDLLATTRALKLVLMHTTLATALDTQLRRQFQCLPGLQAGLCARSTASSRAIVPASPLLPPIPAAPTTPSVFISYETSDSSDKTFPTEKPELGGPATPDKTDDPNQTTIFTAPSPATDPKITYQHRRPPHIDPSSPLTDDSRPLSKDSAKSHQAKDALFINDIDTDNTDVDADDPVQFLHGQSKAKRVPSSQFGRLLGYGGLALGLGTDIASSFLRSRLQLISDHGSSTRTPEGARILSDAGVERIVQTLCRMRGAALKLGQMLSIQDENFLPEQITTIFDRVRAGADYMPTKQLFTQLERGLGADWRDLFLEFDETPIAAASIGQVHKGVLQNGDVVAIKIQYPGVANSIDSDFNAISALLKFLNILPEGMYLDKALESGKRELKLECDYIREAQNMIRYQDLLKQDLFFHVPKVYADLSTKSILITEFVSGYPIDKLIDFPQKTRDRVAESIIKLCLYELIQFNFMQTDPNWANFFYSPKEDKVILLDFGACNTYNENFLRDFIDVIRAASAQDRNKAIELSKTLGYLTGHEDQIMLDAHVESLFVVGEPFREPNAYDFAEQTITARISKLGPIMLKHRLCPPPQETYTINRKLSGAYLICSKLRAKVECSRLFQECLAKNRTFS